MCNTCAMAGQLTLRDIIPVDEVVAPGVEEIISQLAAGGWYPRSRWGEFGIRIWPEGGRSKSEVVDLRLEMNEHRIEVLAEKTGVTLSLEESKEEK